MKARTESTARPVRGLLVALASTALGVGVAHLTHGVPFWIALTVAAVAVVLALGAALRLALLRWWSVPLLPFQQVATVVAGLGLAVVVSEFGFAYLERARPSIEEPSEEFLARVAIAERDGLPLSPEAAARIASREGLITMPPEWEQRVVPVDGAAHAFYWHDVLHVFDDKSMRRTAPIPPRSDERLRIIAIGDSMTYGYGVPEEHTYVSLLERLLGVDGDVEVFSLGQCGRESEDILATLKEALPVLEPDLVVYGVVHNDFLPSGRGQYMAAGWIVPIPEWLESWLLDRSRFAPFTSQAYGATLRTLGLRTDFFEDILADFDGYQKRFARDVAEMNRSVTEAGLPPIVAIVFDQFVVLEGRGHQVTRAAEEHLKAAGMDVISIEDYYTRYDGNNFWVSRWEGHGDELAHAIWASMLAERLDHHPTLLRFREQRFAGGSG